MGYGDGVFGWGQTEGCRWVWWDMFPLSRITKGPRDPETSGNQFHFSILALVVVLK